MGERIKVLVVDDSAFVTAVISKKLETEPEIEVIGVAHDGEEAVEKVKSLNPDVVTLDIIMPRMDGLTALEHIMEERPTPVVMLSALTNESAKPTIKALELGAVDFFLKPSAISPTGDDGTESALIDKIKLAAKVRITRPKTTTKSTTVGHREEKASLVPLAPVNKVLVIGSSAGGPRALLQVIPALPADIPALILIVQHMPPLFTKSLAERLNQTSQLEVKEAETGDKIRPGQALVAPGNYHMTLSNADTIHLNQEPPVRGFRPSIDVAMESVTKVYGASTLGVVLTGMGMDGTRGASLIKAAGGKVIVEDKSTCVIFGMPMSIINAGHADKVVPLHRMASEIVRHCQKKQEPRPEIVP
jgi:two-component system chemotaxis response regulator CheB